MNHSHGLEPKGTVGGRQTEMDDETVTAGSLKQPPFKTKTPEPTSDHGSNPPSTPDTIASFDWEEFESRYEKALHDADEHEQEVLKQADSLSKYFKVWAAAASAHDDERAAKRLQTRRRFVNLSEEKMAQKQQHYMTSTNHVGTAMKYGIPDISKDDLFAFHEAHFSQNAASLFSSTFLNLSEESRDGIDTEVWEEEEDNLGYYEDGVKRTLTDEQIEIFRHSELEALRKLQEKQSSTKAVLPLDEAMKVGDNSSPLALAASTASTPSLVTRNPKKKKKKKGTKRGRPEPKPDLRKRTWDIVDKGLNTLDYD
ncbi:hypothetical protein BGZ63DRAFT_398957 [Mariannaea sp. PMI_226]|nr:hypothetical protein BGZ63DRAFT_398957 [Mariannaea sp. PMI_226]